MSKVLTGMDHSGSFRVYLAVTTDLVEEARTIHNTTPLATAGLGRVLTGAGIMGLLLKNTGDKLTLLFKGDGPAKQILATATQAGEVKGYIANPDVDVWKFYMKEETPKAALPVGVILTLSATGSEMSASSVITNTELGLKRGFNSPGHRPLFSICNPELTYTVSPFQTGCGAVDIMMHTLERYFSIGENTPLSDRIAEGVLKTVIPAGKAALENPNDYEARASIMWAGTISHNDLTGLGRDVFMAVHQMEHELSGMDEKIAHGAGLSALWASWARYVYKDDVSRFAQYAVNVWNIEMNFEHPEKTALAGIQATEDYFKSLDMPVSLRELNVDPASFEELAEKCTNYGKRTLAGIKVLDKPDIIEIYKMAY